MLNRKCDVIFWKMDSTRWSRMRVKFPRSQVNSDIIYFTLVRAEQTIFRLLPQKYYIIDLQDVRLTITWIICQATIDNWKIRNGLKTGSKSCGSDTFPFDNLIDSSVSANAAGICPGVQTQHASRVQLFFSEPSWLGSWWWNNVGAMYPRQKGTYSSIRNVKWWVIPVPAC